MRVGSLQKYEDGEGSRSPVLSSKAVSGEREYNLYELLYAVVLGDEYREGISASQLFCLR